MEHTMRDLLSKLDALISETALKDKEDLQAKRKALQDLQMDPTASEDPEIRQAIMQRKAELEKEAKAKGFTEDQDIYQIGDNFGISFSEDFEIGTEIVDILEDGIVIDLDETALDYLTQNGFTFEEVQLDEEKKKGVDGKACWKGYRYAGREKKADGSYKDKCVEVGEGYDDESDRYVQGIDGEDFVKSYYSDVGDQKEITNWFLDKLGLPPDSELYFDDDDLVWGDQTVIPGLLGNQNPMTFNDAAKELEDYLKNEGMATEAKYQGREVPLGKPMKGDVKKSKVYVRGPKGNVVKVNFGDKKMRIKKSNPNRRKSFRARHNCKNPGPRWKARYWSCRAW